MINRIATNLVLALCVTPFVTLAADEPADRAAQIEAKLNSGDAQQIDGAVEMIRQTLSQEAPVAVDVAGVVRYGPLLMKARRYTEAAELTQQAIRVMPDGFFAVPLQVNLIEALRAGGKTQEALAAAKGYYNVCPMDKTPNAVKLVGECLLAANPSDPEILRRFKMEQAAGATTRPLTEDASQLPKSMLKDVRVDAKPFEKSIEQWRAKGPAGTLGLGNLLLLADRPQEAYEVFLQAYGRAESDSALEQALESMARCVRAMDGTVGRANAFSVAIKEKGYAAAVAELDAALKKPATRPTGS